MKKFGFYGGSFDPIHFGHLYLAIQLAEHHGLDHVFVCPSFCSPFKEEPVASASHRFEMVRLAVEGIPHFSATPVEIERGGVSYTIDTIRSLPKAQYHLLLSDESAAHLDQWKESDELIRLAPPLIGSRLKKGFTKTQKMEISSTEIRDRLEKNLYCGHLVPSKALDYILQHRLYSGSN